MALLAALIPLGRWEGRRAIEREQRGMAKVRAAIGPSLDAPTLSDWYDEPSGAFSCLRYWVGTDPYALEVCFDRKGRLIEATDERSGLPRIWSLRYRPKAAKIRIEPSLYKELKRKLVLAQPES